MKRRLTPFATALLLTAVPITFQPASVLADEDAPPDVADLLIAVEEAVELTVVEAVEAIEAVVAEDAAEEAVEEAAEEPAEGEAAPAKANENKKDADDAGPLAAEKKDSKKTKKLTEAEKKKAAEEKKKQKKQTEKEKLAKIVLPENPTRKQCEEYVAALRKHCEGRGLLSSGDKEVGKLKAIPMEHIDLVLQEMSGDGPLQFYARYSLRNLELDEHKEGIVSRLAEHPNNIIFVVHYGWFQQAKPTILNHLENADATEEVKAAWFQAYVEVAEPKHYKKLHEITVNTRDIDNYIPLLKTLPDYDLNHTIRAAWKGVDTESHDYYKRQALAPFAVEFGHVEALGVLVTSLQDSPNYNMRLERVNVERLNITRFIDFRGTDKEIKDWFEANKDKLVFDTFRKKFVVPEEF